MDHPQRVVVDEGAPRALGVHGADLGRAASRAPTPSSALAPAAAARAPAPAPAPPVVTRDVMTTIPDHD